MTGRPFRFMATMLAAWTLGRVAIMWPTIDSMPALIRAVAPPAAAATGFYAATPPPPAAAAAIAPPRRVSRLPVPPPAIAARPLAPSTAASVAAPAAEPVAPLQPPPLRLPAIASPATPGRFAASLWAVARAGFDEARPGAQLGGSQAGLRVTYALDRGRRLALSARLSTPLQGGVREAAVGLDWQPFALPLHVLAEQRFATGEVRDGPAVLVVGGVDPRPLPAGLSVEAYGQAGAVARDRVEGFVDGAVRVTRPVLHDGRLRLDLGVGGWGGAQRGAARLDLGPTLAMTVPLAERALRLTLDWRQRVAGGARPGSGPALTIGGDL